MLPHLEIQCNMIRKHSIPITQSKDKRRLAGQNVEKELNKCSDKCMEVELPALSATYNRPTNRRPTTQRTDALIGKFHFQ